MARDSCPEEVLRLFQAMAEDSSATVWRADADGYVRALAERESTGAFEGWLGRGWLERVHPEDAPRVRAASREASAQGFVEITCRAIAGDEYRWFRVRGARIPGCGGQPGHWLGLISDVGAQASEQEALARTEQAYRALVEATASLVWRWRDGDGFTEGSGWAFPRTFNGNEWLEYLHPADRERAAAAWSEALAKGSTSVLEYTDDAILREGRMRPGDAFLAKPYRRAKLAEAVADALSAQVRSPGGR